MKLLPMSKKRAAASCLLAISGLLFAMPGAWAGNLLLGPQDKLKIKVYEWRPVSAEAYEWTAFNGVFAVAASGNVALPLIGDVPAAGHTLEQFSDDVGARLQSKLGLANRPQAAVEVAEYRPFYIVGFVSTPGRYPYIPGLDVMQAIGIAGGALSSKMGVLELRRDAIANHGDIRALAIERLALLAKLARLEAITQDAADVAFPEEVMKQMQAPATEQIVKQEKLLFDSQRRGLESKVDALEQSKVLLQREIDTLKAKRTSVGQQLTLAKKELGAVNDLAKKGLAISARQIAASQSVAQLESNSLDIDLSILRAEQDISRSDREILDLHNRQRSETLTEASDLGTKIAANAAKIETANNVSNNIEDQTPQLLSSLGNESSALSITITRDVEGQKKTIKADPTDEVEPGDIVQVTRSPRRDAASSEADGQHVLATTR